ncbi:hypothetical protein IW136_001010 [Coemansia sp. RSA 678]|nr:hypothetical protein IW136_001010 [Coemansia sp. RSA 678]
MSFVAAYEYIAAELSWEEHESVRKIVEANHGMCNSKQIMDVLISEHPLCLESDLLESFTKAAAHLPHHNATTHSPVVTHVSLTTVAKKAAEEDPDDPNNVNNTRWSPDETRLLLEYLEMTRGRKNWIKCAQYVGSRSSAQCKAKHNNMRAQEITHDILEI